VVIGKGRTFAASIFFFAEARRYFSSPLRVIGAPTVSPDTNKRKCQSCMGTQGGRYLGKTQYVPRAPSPTTPSPPFSAFTSSQVSVGVLYVPK